MTGHSSTGNPAGTQDATTTFRTRTRTNAISLSEEEKIRTVSSLRDALHMDETPVMTEVNVSAGVMRQDLPPADVPEDTQPAQQATVKERTGMDKKREDKMKEHLAEATRYETLAQSETDEKKRKELLKKKEKEEIEANSYKKRLKISDMTDKVEQDRELSTYHRHQRFDALKKVFYKPSQFAHEEAEFVKPAEGQSTARRFKNIGRAFFGGTKPMYKFQEEGSGQVYLYKEAVNCIGVEKTSGAIVTEAASRLQRQICGDDCCIEAFATKDATGKVVGSMQKMIRQVDEADRFDLFSWQAHPEKEALPEALKKEILREHTLDWLLCNFDTKGENFLHQSTVDGKQLCSFDKEASFSYLEDQGAQHMSTTYKPHSNDTLYNVMFTQFAEGKLDLNLQDAITAIERATAIDDDEYMANFDEMLRSRYKSDEERAAARAKILERKTNLVQEYRQFFSELLERRRDALAKAGKAFDHKEDLVDGKFRFANTTLAQPRLEDEISEPVLSHVEQQQHFASYGTTPDVEKVGKVHRERNIGLYWNMEVIQAEAPLRPGITELRQRIVLKHHLGGELLRNGSGTKEAPGMNLSRHILNMGEYLGEDLSDEQIESLYDNLAAYTTVTESSLQEEKDKADAKYEVGMKQLRELYYVQVKRLEATYGTLMTQMHPDDFIRQIEDPAEFKKQFGIIQDLMNTVDYPEVFGIESPRDDEYIRLVKYYVDAYHDLQAYASSYSAGMTTEGDKIVCPMPGKEIFEINKATKRNPSEEGIGGPHMEDEQLRSYRADVSKRGQKGELYGGWWT